jgi:hypothetical protein
MIYVSFNVSIEMTYVLSLFANLVTHEQINGVIK